MLIFMVRNIKRRLIKLLSAILLWVFAIYLAGVIVNSSFILSVTINGYMSFQYPLSIKVSSIYAREDKQAFIETTGFLGRPVKRGFSNYKSLKGNFSFDYPSLFSIVPGKMAGEEILYHIDFFNRQKEIKGFVQVWEMPYELEQFLEKSIRTSSQNYKYFFTDVENLNGRIVYLWDYIIINKANISYKGMEAFFKEDGKMYRISMFSPEKKWNKSCDKIFLKMAKSLKTD